MRPYRLQHSLGRAIDTVVTQISASHYLKRTAQWVGLSLLLGATGCDVSRNSATPSVQEGDPAVVDYPVAFVARPLPVDEDGNRVTFDVLDPAAFNPGAQLILKDRASASAAEQVLTADIFVGTEDAPALYDVKDLSVSPDGRKLLFAMRAPEIEDADEDDQPTWNIWEYDLDAAAGVNKLRRVIQSDLQAERGDDVAPQYLPNGKIVFSSNRQTRTRAILTDELKPQYSGLDDKRDDHAFVLHVMDDDGENIEQISYNVSQDLQPTVLDNGDLLFLRRDGISQKDQLSLYTSKIDGSDIQPYYGYHSQETGTGDTEAAFVRPRPLPDGRVLVLLQPRESARLGGDMVAIDGTNFIDATQPTSDNTGSPNNAQTSLSPGDVDTSGETLMIGGLYSSAYPLYDGTNRLLVSWSPCRRFLPTAEQIQTGLDQITPEPNQIRPCTAEFDEEGLEPAQPLYGLWIYNQDTNTHLPIKTPAEGFMYTDAVVLAPPLDPIRWQAEGVDPELVDENVGLIHIRSVYDIDGVDVTPDGLGALTDPAQTPVDARPVRFLRIVKNVPIPDDDVLDFDNSLFGRSTAQGMREILGYVPVEPDGSALFKVPADVPIMLDLLDAEGKRVIVRHENWMYVRPGEKRECTGCHTSSSTLPHGRRDAERASINAGAIGGVEFANSRLVDRFGIAQPLPESGESMAEYYARINGPRTPSVDLLFTDEWTNANNAVPGTEISLRYVDIETPANANPADSRCAPLDNEPLSWLAPTQCVDAGSWNSLCRITINYLDSISPLWQSDRRSCNELGEVTADNTCVSCHTRSVDGVAQVPAGQLELTAEISQDRNDFETSYAELMFTDNAQELVEGSLTDILIPNDTGEFETDADGNLVLDVNGQPIPIIEFNTVPVNPVMSTTAARASNRFFNLFNAGGTHAGMLSPAELKLIAEWLDIGGQYYNNPFDAPAN